LISVSGVWWVLYGTGSYIWMHVCIHTMQKGDPYTETVVAKSGGVMY